MNRAKPKVFCLMGPTASGKTALAINLVQRLPLEIISVDSGLIYRGMDIGTAKPSKAELALAPHHLINIRDPAESYSAGQFCEEAKIEIQKILAKGKIPFLVGGTMLYFRALQKGIADLPKANPEIRKKIHADAEELGWPILHQQLASIDPVAASNIHPNDAQRIGRALEVYLSTGETITKRHNIELPEAEYEFINLILLPPDRTLLHLRIAERIDKMIELGFVEEVRSLYERGDLHPDLPAMRTVGYRQVWGYLAGDYDFATMRDKAIAATRQLAKRQYTWLRSWEGGIRLEEPKTSLAYDFIKSIINQ